MKKQKFKKPVILGFAALYLTVMGLSVCLMAAKYADDLEQNFWQKAGSVQNMQAENRQSGVWYQSFVNFHSYSVGKFSYFSAAAYDEEGKLLAKSGNIAGGGPIVSLGPDSEPYGVYSLDTAFSKKDVYELADYQKIYQDESASQGDRQRPPKYRICTHLSEDGENLYGITVQEITWETGQEHKDEYTDPLLLEPCSYEVIPRMEKDGVEHFSSQYAVIWYETDSRVIFNRKAKPYEGLECPDGKFVETPLYFPYLAFGSERWKKWNENKYLHDFTEQTDVKNTMSSLETPFSLFRLRKAALIPIEPDDNENGRFYLEMRMESRPWLAALDYMKYVYLAGAALTLACMIKIIYSANRIYNRQEAMDEHRKNVVHTMAHELKEPLKRIKDLAENLQGCAREETRDRYLRQIIEQTEKIDRLVGEMIQVSKTDTKYRTKGEEEDGK